MKKKIMSLCLIVCMLAVAVIGGTLAYFTDTDEAENTFTFGNVSIVQHEQDRDENEFKQNQNIYPAVHDKLLPKVSATVDGYDFQIRKLEGNYIDKIVNVENDGTEPAYVRTIIAIPSMNGYDDGSPVENPLHWNYLEASDFAGKGWDWTGAKGADLKVENDQTDKISAVTIGGVEYDLYVATYSEAVEAGAYTSPSMVGFYLDKSVDYGDIDGDGDNEYFSVQNDKKIDLSDWMKVGTDGKVTLSILVASQACQTEGFDDAWEALDAAFGDITAAKRM